MGPQRADESTLAVETLQSFALRKKSWNARKYQSLLERVADISAHVLQFVAQLEHPSFMALASPYALLKAQCAALILKIARAWVNRNETPPNVRGSQSARTTLTRIKLVMQEIVSLYKLAISVGRANNEAVVIKEAMQEQKKSRKAAKNGKHLKFVPGKCLLF